MDYPNTFPFPNEIVNGWNTRLKGSELKLLLVIVRQTLGWILDPKTGMRKEEDWISYKQLREKTGLATESLSKAIDSLVKYGLIQVRGQSGELLNTSYKRMLEGKRRGSFIYRLNLTVLKTETHCFENRSSTVSKIESNKINSYKTNSYKTSTKVLAGDARQPYGNVDVNDLIKYLKERLGLPSLDGSEKTNRRYAWLLLKKFKGLENCQCLIDAAYEDDWFKNNITSTKELYYKGIKLIARKRGGTSGERTRAIDASNL